ncbi:MAG: hypothetical protein EAZ74_01830 [Alphaproteobacteria bacterium]|nr:MAG: hypothetical protein EAY76_06090 [Alphaproteobacteria bacterium]TAF15430.1 MAG: hypothetical protein EAZ74_01830 [Alphaproteobacteria bacterium]TAF40284.1 MAG: hypothetical protein EAZ66_03465 [Alphaproteobacteria bacterium]TAF77418.1 MAG: hypothetical protein EAZ52_00530 [Alphaproteobacteria bacterium]
MSYEKTDATVKKTDDQGVVTSLLVAAFVIVLVVISFLAYKSGVDPKQLKADVVAFQAKISELYAAEGIDVKLDYAQIEAEGGLFRKTITLSDPSLAIKTDKVHYTLGSTNAIISPTDERYHEFTVELASPVTVHYGNSSRVAHLVSQKPFTIALLKDKEDGKYYYQMPLHEQFSLKVSEGGAEKIYDITAKVEGSEPLSHVSGAFIYGDMKHYEVTAQLTDATIVNDKATTRLSEASYVYSLEDAQEVSEFHVGNVTSDLIPQTLAPLALDVTQRAQIHDEGARRVIDIEQMKLAGTGFSVDVGGELTLSDGELLPLARVHVSTQGAATLLDALTTANIMPATIKELVVTSLKRIAPSWNGKVETPLEFALVRTSDSPFMIGAMKADELFAMLFQQYFMMQQQAIQNMTPPAVQETDAPKTDVPADAVTPEVTPEATESIPEESKVEPEATTNATPKEGATVAPEVAPSDVPAKEGVTPEATPAAH